MFIVSSDRSSFIENWKTLLSPVEVQQKNGLAEMLLAEDARPTALAIIDGTRLGQEALQPESDLARAARRTRLLVADASFDVEMELAALALGVVGCCPPHLSPEELRKIVDVVLKGGIWVSRNALPDMLNHLRQATMAPQNDVTRKLDNLTPRERQIASCVAQGASNKAIARELKVSDVTVKAHLTTIFQKLGVTGRVQLALLLSEQNHKQPKPPQRVA